MYKAYYVALADLKGEFESLGYATNKDLLLVGTIQSNLEGKSVFLGKAVTENIMDTSSSGSTISLSS